MNSRSVLSYTMQPNEELIIPIGDLKSPYIITGETHGKLDWHANTKQLIFRPDTDFSGDVHFTIRQEENSSLEYDINILVANVFKPRARIIKIIGQELISNDVIALVELIKNSFDADATDLTLNLNDIFSKNGQIVITDNGLGMSYDKITNVWLEPATPDKKSYTEKTFSRCFQRRLLGEKGIGRFAVHRLGENIELITRAKTDCENTLLDYETTVSINWEDFIDEKYLNEIPIKIHRDYEPKFFTNSSGTIIKIGNIAPWKDIKAVKDAIVKIKGLESPVKPKKIVLHKLDNIKDPGLTVTVNSDNVSVQKELSEIKSLSELLNTAFYKFDGIINSQGEITYEYEFNRVDYQDIKRPRETYTEDLKKYDLNWFENHPLNETNTPFSFEVTFYAWDLDNAALKVAGLADYHKNIIRPNAGIRIYRDNFRVWPYGEPDDDWLGLDINRLNAPKDRSVSRNQVFGIIHISSIENPLLKDQSNREGLISNEQYEQFYHLVSASIAVFARERKKDKIKIEQTSNTLKTNDSITDSLKDLRTKILENNHKHLYDNEINKIEQTYRKSIEDVTERYMMAAAIGISYSLPIHEMKLRISSIKHLLEDLGKHPEMFDNLLRQLMSNVSETQDIITAVTSIMSRQKKQKVKLKSVAENVYILKQLELKKYNITYNILGDESLVVDAAPGLLNTAVLNLVDNSIYWLRIKITDFKDTNRSFNPNITIEYFVENNKTILMIKDNGYGFEDPFELLKEPYYSRKIDGLGLGLYLTNEIVIRFGGRIEGYNDNGAVIKLIF